MIFVAAAFAQPFVGFAAGPGVVTGSSPDGDYVSPGPVGAIDVTWHRFIVQSWVGATASWLLVYTPEGVIPASILAIEGGAGFGTRTFAAGVFGSIGFPGGQVGLYARGMAPTGSRLGRVGVEGRLFGTDVGDAGGVAVLLRVEPGKERRVEPRPPPPPYPPPRPPPRGPRVEPPPDGTPRPDGEHHEDPYAMPPQAEPATPQASPAPQPPEPAPQLPEPAPQLEPAPLPAEQLPAEPATLPAVPAPPPADEHHEDPYE